MQNVTVIFLNCGLCHKDCKTFRLKKKKKYKLGKKKLLCIQTLIHINMEKNQSCQQIHLHLSSKLTQLCLLGELTSILPYITPHCRYCEAEGGCNEISVYFHPFLQGTLRSHISFPVQGLGFFHSIFNSLHT